MEPVERAKRFRMARTELNRNGEETFAQVYEATGISSSTVCDLENPENGRVPSSRSLGKLAEHYGVNAAWLAGQSESWALNEDSQIVTKMTGLSPRAIEKLGALMQDEQTRAFVNAMIESDEFADLIGTIGVLYDQVNEADEESGIAQDVDYAQVMRRHGRTEEAVPFTFCESDYRDMIRWKASRQLEKLISRIIK